MRVILLVSLFTIVCGMAYQPKKKEKAATLISQQYVQDLLHFRGQVAQLDSLVNEGSSFKVIQGQLQGTRLAYKRVEYLMDYQNTNFVYHFLNGPPLQKINKNDEGALPIPPNGLQRIEEIVFGEDNEGQRTELKRISSELKTSIYFLIQSESKSDFGDRQIMEAMMSGVIRVAFLGLSGFDTPASDMAIEESKTSWETMDYCLKLYQEEEGIHGPEIKQAVEFMEAGMQAFSESTGFDEFDRIDFVKNIVTPLYASLGRLRVAASLDDNRGKTHAQSYRADQIFSPVFLDNEQYAYYTYMPLNSPERITLGKILFHDPILSKNVRMSCASCHHPDKAFAAGLEEIETDREIPTLIDAGFASRHFWDMRSSDLERQVAHVVADDKEFNTNFKDIAERLKRSETYVRLFDEAYGDISEEDINARSISNAIAAYVNSLNSFNSLFDKYMRGGTDWELPSDAKRGYNLFMGKAACGTCHFPPSFNGTVPPFYQETESEVLGITMGVDTLNPVLDTDPGRWKNGLVTDAHAHFEGSMKTVTVRNTSLTAPYMHNGQFATLREVIEFYNLGGGAGMGLDVPHQTLPADHLGLSPREKRDIISFLHTLKDVSGLDPGHIKLPTFETRPDWNSRATY